MKKILLYSLLILSVLICSGQKSKYLKYDDYTNICDKLSKENNLIQLELDKIIEPIKWEHRYKNCKNIIDKWLNKTHYEYVGCEEWINSFTEEQIKNNLNSANKIRPIYLKLINKIEKNEKTIERMFYLRDNYSGTYCWIVLSNGVKVKARYSNGYYYY